MNKCPYCKHDPCVGAYIGCTEYRPQEIANELRRTERHLSRLWALLFAVIFAGVLLGAWLISRPAPQPVEEAPNQDYMAGPYYTCPKCDG